MAADLVINERWTIPANEFSIRTSRAGGPGGQGVNTTDSRVQLTWHLSSSKVNLPKPVMERLRKARPGWVNRHGDLVLIGASHRSQMQNLDDVRQRLVDAIKKALVRPKVRRATKPTKGSVRRRIEQKKRRGDIKNNRKKVRE